MLFWKGGMQDARCKMQDARCKIQDTRYKIQDTRYKNINLAILVLLKICILLEQVASTHPGHLSHHCHLPPATCHLPPATHPAPPAKSAIGSIKLIHFIVTTSTAIKQFLISSLLHHGNSNRMSIPESLVHIVEEHQCFKENWQSVLPYVTVHMVLPS
jgi:hypothetical protein